MSFYTELLAASAPKDSMAKTASVKDSASLRADLESAGLTGQRIEVLAGEIMGIFEKKAESDANLPVQATQEPAAAAPAAPAPAAPEVDPAQVVATDAVMTGDAQTAAIESAKASIDDAATALNALENLNANEAAKEVTNEIPAEQAPAASDPAAVAAPTPAPVDQTVVKQAGEAEAEAEEKDGEAKEAEGEAEEKEGEAEEADAEAKEKDDEDDEEAKLAYIMEHGTEAEKTALVNDAYDKALLKLANSGMGLSDYVFAKVGGDEYLAAQITDKSIKLAALSDQNCLKVADDILYHMEKTASAL